MSLLDVVRFKRAEAMGSAELLQELWRQHQHPSDGRRGCGRQNEAVLKAMFAPPPGGRQFREWRQREEVIGGDKNVLRSQRSYYTLISSSA
jgi:hypothetical protein